MPTLSFAKLLDAARTSAISEELVNEYDEDASYEDDQVPVPVPRPEPPPRPVIRRIRSRPRRTAPRSRTIANRSNNNGNRWIFDKFIPDDITEKTRLLHQHRRRFELEPEEEAQAPTTWADCEGKTGPCPWVRCKYNLYLDVDPVNGSIKLNFPNKEVWELAETCALRVADAGAHTLEEVGDLLNVTRERLRQIETRGLLMLKQDRRTTELAEAGEHLIAKRDEMQPIEDSTPCAQLRRRTRRTRVVVVADSSLDLDEGSDS